MSFNSNFDFLCSRTYLACPHFCPETQSPLNHLISAPVLLPLFIPSILRLLLAHARPRPAHSCAAMSSRFSFSGSLVCATCQDIKSVRVISFLFISCRIPSGGLGASCSCCPAAHLFWRQKEKIRSEQDRNSRGFLVGLCFYFFPCLRVAPSFAM